MQVLFSGKDIEHLITTNEVIKIKETPIDYQKKRCTALTKTFCGLAKIEYDELTTSTGSIVVSWDQKVNVEKI